MASLTALATVLKSFDGSLTLGQLRALIQIALEPGLSINTLAERLEISQQSASRHAAILLGRYQTLENVTSDQVMVSQQISLDDPRKRALFVTEKGAASIAVIERCLFDWCNHESTTP